MQTTNSRSYQFEIPRPHMAKVKSKDTGPELLLRSLLRDMGFRGYRIHFEKLPGRPDIVFTRRKRVIFVHGCFWHGHNCPAGSHRPKSNEEYWDAKLLRNVERDQKHLSEIIALGWQVLVVWECQLKNHEFVRKIITNFMR
ncbi:MAG: DNA mismatch endonuclease Vsr [Gammaproteobacteria bacterium]|nr:DNA mismatch endonuclease Vsr [Gammaproteobacteria bacterium]